MENTTETNPTETQATELTFSSELLNLVDKALKHNKFGSLLFKANNLKGALKHYTKAAEIASEAKFPFSNVYQNIGNIHAQNKDYKLALENFEKVMQESPHRSDFQEPEDKLITKIIMNPHLNSKSAYADAFTNASFTLLGIQEPEKAVEYCKKALELEPDNKDTYINFGNALRQVGRRDEAISMTWEMIKKETSKNGKNFEIRQVDVTAITKTPAEDNDPVNIITVKWGTKYDSEYVNKLYRGFKRNTTKSFNFICFTDDSTGLCEGIEPRALIKNWTKWWGKATIFSKEHQLKGVNFFIDLDMIITGNIDDIMGFGEGRFALMRTDEIENETLNKGGYNSSVLMWRGDHFACIFEMLEECFEELQKFVFR